jgi:hypothetical protein
MGKEKEEKKKSRYNIRPIKMESVERKVNKTLEAYDHIGREVDATMRIGANLNDRFQRGAGNVADWLMGPGFSNNDGRRRQQQQQQQEQSSDSSRGYEERHESPPPHSSSSARRSHNSGTVTISIEITDNDIFDAAQAFGIDPDDESVQDHRFLDAVRKEFEFQLNEGIKKNMGNMLVKTVENVDREFTRRYGRS